MVMKAKNASNVTKQSSLQEPAPGTKEYSDKYPHGKYKNAAYHTLKGNSVKSPCPKNGQAALDRSCEVKGSDQRVAVEDGKIVILKHEGNGIYHGYLVDDFHSIQDGAVRKALVDNQLVRNAKSGKIL